MAAFAGFAELPHPVAKANSNAPPHNRVNTFLVIFPPHVFYRNAFIEMIF
jgi:hypothetical protein